MLSDGDSGGGGRGGCGGKRAPAMPRTVGVLALQGSYNEHIAALRRVGARGVAVRKAEQLDTIGALIIPGGESTTMAKLAQYHNLFPALREFVKCGKPVWGTCAGLIFLADKAIGQKEGGQELIGGLDCTVHRNFFGSQLESFETELSVPELAAQEGGSLKFRGVFIRAPAILEVGPGVEVLANVIVQKNTSINAETTSEGQEDGHVTMDKVVVAARQGNLLVTAFHPELTADCRWHSFFMKMSNESEEYLKTITSSEGIVDYDGKRPIDLPVFES